MFHCSNLQPSPPRPAIALRLKPHHIFKSLYHHGRQEALDGIGRDLTTGAIEMDITAVRCPGEAQQEMSCS